MLWSQLVVTPAHPEYRVHQEPREQLGHLAQLDLLEARDHLVPLDSQDLLVPLDLRDFRVDSDLLDRMVPPVERGSLEPAVLAEPLGRPVRKDKLDLRALLVHRDLQARLDLLERLEMLEPPDLLVALGQLVLQDLLALQGT